MMLAIFARLAVVFGQQIYQQAALGVRQTRSKRDLTRNTIQIMDEQNGIATPVIANCEHRRISSREDFKIAPTDFRDLLPHANDALGPVEERVGIAALVLGGALIYAAWAVWKQGGNKVAWRMYKWSSTYLLFIFLAIMIDSVWRVGF